MHVLSLFFIGISSSGMDNVFCHWEKERPFQCFALRLSLIFFAVVLTLVLSLIIKCSLLCLPLYSFIRHSLIAIFLSSVFYMIDILDISSRFFV